MKKRDILAGRAGEYQELQKQLRSLSLLAQGSVFAIEPPPDASRANTHYKWTRKVRAKTVSVTLSSGQYEALKSAIAANRRVEKILARMRQISQDAILKALPDSPGKQAAKLS